MVVVSLLYAVCLYGEYEELDTLSPYIYYELLGQHSSIYTVFCKNNFALHLRAFANGSRTFANGS